MFKSNQSTQLQQICLLQYFGDFLKIVHLQLEAVALMVLKAVWQADVAQKSQQNSVKSASFLLI